MKIPDKIRIGGVDYEVRSVDHLNNGEKVCYGQISYEEAAIKINPSNQEHQMQCVTLWHEILHAIFAHAALDCRKLDITDANVEMIIEVMSKGIYQVLQDNGKSLFDIV